MQKKLLIVTSELKYSGPNNVIRSLIHGLDNLYSSQLEILLTPLRIKYEHKFIQSLSPCEVILQKNHFSFIHLLRVIIKTKPDVINTHGIRADLFVFLLSWFFSFKHICTVHNNPKQDYSMRYTLLLAKMMTFAHGIIFRSKRVIKVAVSKQVMSNLDVDFQSVNTNFIYNGVIQEEFDKSQHIDKNVGAVQGNSSNRIRAIFCGHLTEIKNPFAIIELAVYRNDIEFILLGDGPLYSELKNRIQLEKLTNVCLEGRVTNVADYLANAQLFIMPSRTEGMPMAFIEALFFNLPGLCSNIPIFSELSNIKGISIELFDLDNERSLEKSMDKIIKNISLNKGNETRNRDIACETFSSISMAEQYWETFNVR